MEALAGLPARLTDDQMTPLLRESVPSYKLPHLQFHLAQTEVRELLMGEELYSDPTLAIRELYQNALDACRYRQARVEYLIRTDKYKGKEWKGGIIFRQGLEMGRPYIECIDNGIGMGERELAEAFARAGRKFSDMPEFIEEQADWLRCDPPIRLFPNSQFGIGVFSYFMLADEIRVRTCRLRRDGIPDKGLEVRIAGSESLFRMTPWDASSDGGTEVRLYLNPRTRDDEPISCFKTLTDLLWIAEYETTVEEEGTPMKHWAPGNLYHPDSLDVEPIKGITSNIWWVKNRGVVLADGIVTDKHLNCNVVNLRAGHRPKLSLDRRTPLDWDKKYVTEAQINSVEALYRDETWLTHEWLWKLEEENVAAASRLFSALIDSDASISIELPVLNRGPLRSSFRISETGCTKIDQDIFRIARSRTGGNSEKIREYEETLHKIGDKVLKNRIKIWKEKGAKFPPDFYEFIIRYYREPHIFSLAPQSSLPVSFPGDAILFEYKNRNGDKISLTSLIMAYCLINEPPSFFRVRLERCSKLGLEMPEIDVDSLGDLQITEEDLIILSPNFDQSFNWWFNPTLISLGRIIQAAAKLNEPVANTVKRFQRFKAVGLDMPKIDVDSLGDLRITEKDLVILSYQLRGFFKWKDAVSISAESIIRAAVKLNEPIANTVKRFQRFSALGFEMPEINVDSLGDLRPTAEDLVILSPNLDGIGPGTNFAISAAHVKRAAFKLGKTSTYVADQIRQFAPIGFEVRD